MNPTGPWVTQMILSSPGILGCDIAWSGTQFLVVYTRETGPGRSAVYGQLVRR